MIYRLRPETGLKNSREIGEISIAFGSTIDGGFVSNGSKIKLRT
jgi:hypothetical protein